MRVHRSFVIASLLFSSIARSGAAAADEGGNAVPPKSVCGFGVLAWCFATTQKSPTAPDTKFRVELFGGYKPSNLYYGTEIKNCEAAGCSLAFNGPAFGLDAFYNVGGDSQGDDYFDVGVSTSYMPIVTGMKNNTQGFQGELGPVAPGAGTLAYVPLRLTLRRPNFLYVIRSQYLISAFGAGIAFPVTTGAGDTFTGGDGPKITLGGRLGAQLPITDVLKVGLATNWSVVWYGADFGQASFQASYGVNVAYQL
jgi:hypothetical protein